MKISKYQTSDEKTILSALIVHDKVLGRVYDHLGKLKDPFRNKWANLVASWCFNFYKHYGRAPRRQIQSLFLKYAQSQPDEESIGIVESFLSHLSDYTATAQEINENFVIDLASQFFEKIRLERMASDIQLSLERGDLKEARQNYTDYQSTQFSTDDWSDPFAKGEMRETLEYYEQDRSIIQFPGDLGCFLSPHFERDGFIAFAAPEKRGKSFWLLEVVWQAIRQRRKVLYYVLGDMSKSQVNHRLYRRITLRTARGGRVRYPLSIKLLGKDENGHLQVAIEDEMREVSALNLGAIRKARLRLETLTATKEPLLRVRVAGASIVSASEMERDVERFAQSGWVPDLVVLDYADLLAAEADFGRQEYRHQVDSTWKILRRIPLTYHCLMVTATQTAARSYDGWLIRKKDFSEDKRKNAHISGMLGINQTSEEKPKGIYRLNWVFLRDGEWSDSQIVWTAGNLALACPCLRSALPH